MISLLNQSRIGRTDRKDSYSKTLVVQKHFLLNIIFVTIIETIFLNKLFGEEQIGWKI